VEIYQFYCLSKPSGAFFACTIKKESERERTGDVKIAGDCVNERRKSSLKAQEEIT
jgi:hypothetical protein